MNAWDSSGLLYSFLTITLDHHDLISFPAAGDGLWWKWVMGDLWIARCHSKARPRVCVCVCHVSSSMEWTRQNHCILRSPSTLTFHHLRVAPQGRGFPVYIPSRRSLGQAVTGSCVVQAPADHHTLFFTCLVHLIIVCISFVGTSSSFFTRVCKHSLEVCVWFFFFFCLRLVIHFLALSKNLSFWLFQIIYKYTMFLDRLFYSSR